MNGFVRSIHFSELPLRPFPAVGRLITLIKELRSENTFIALEANVYMSPELACGVEKQVLIRADRHRVPPLLYFTCLTLIFFLLYIGTPPLASQSEYGDKFSIFYSDICPQSDNSSGATHECSLIKKPFFFPSDIAM